MWMALFYRLLGVVGLVLLVFVIVRVESMLSVFRPATYDEAQVQCLAAILRADTYGEAASNRARAQELVADVANRVHKQTGLGYCEILQDGTTFFPEGWKHGFLFRGRYVEAIAKSPRYPGVPWLETVERAQRLMGEPDSSGCATRYVRVEQRYAWATDEDSAAELITTRMQPDERGAQLKTKFFCPR